MASDYRGKNKLHFGLRYALNGIKLAVMSERNIKIHFIAALLVVILGVVLSVSPIEWAVLALTIGAVISMEMMNTALEKALDYVEPNHQPKIGIAKDMAAGAVLITAIIALFIATIIFVPKIITWLS
ncbi:diacylglycerol kinase family protein [Gracilibacillus sp. S3-1-1]|uniref:Diacylglycerol kinase family protein n=1 Tax=Gracilibacillus pellucidus TaxID=3095368 RepID=A0ACC6M530_9BACI|nr:diacylglycerol kinase family protein [Gracilibacillus sp. S3-1-1]MDX8045952.1 diacylglycerol kinase family protein [Gracilibacillus sp. S3-1-1]